MEWRIPLFQIHWDESDVRAVARTIRRGRSWATGPEVAGFEKGLAAFVGREHCSTFNSGTSALHALLLAHGIGKGDEVIVPSFTFIATANAVLMTGARPVFADVEPESLGLDPEDAERRLSARTRAIIAVDFGGGLCRLEELSDLASRKRVLLIEDAAESIGATRGRLRAGAAGDGAILSFCQNKVVTTGEGGAALTDSRKVAERLKLVRSHGRAEARDYFSSTSRAEYVSLGYNFRMSSLSAALGSAQLARIGKIIGMRRKVAARYGSRLRGAPGVEIVDAPPGTRHVYQLYTIRTKRRDQLVQRLAKAGIMSKVYFHPVHRTRFYRHLLAKPPRLPETDRAGREVLSLPIFPGMKDAVVDEVVDRIRSLREG